MASNHDAAQLDSPRELELRLTLIPLGDTVRGYFFNCALEQVRLQVGEEALRHCVEVSGLEPPTAFFKYPMSALLRVLYHVAWALTDSAGGFDASLRQIGQWTAREFLDGSVGRTMSLLAGRNLKRLADYLPTAYRTGWEHGWGEVSWTGSGQCLVSIHGNVVPYPYFEGVFLEIFQAAGATNLKVKGWQVSPANTRYSLSWD
ncbi:MAG TPA: TIGR02265 family protein [Archangium sp.]|nr:TIGR02265 family protein [Archangium sp.]